MKNILMLVAFSMATLFTNAQDLTKVKTDKSPMDAAFYPADAAKRQFAKSEEQRKNLEPQIRLLYSRPALNGRTLFEGLLKYGKAWRAGANESTELLFMRDVLIGETKLEAGRYSLIVTPEKGSWKIHINSENDGWGNYSHKPELDLVTIDVPVKMTENNLELLTMLMYSPDEGSTVHLKIGWGNYEVEVPISLK